MTVFDSLVDKISRFAITCTYAFTCFFYIWTAEGARWYGKI